MQQYLVWVTWGMQRCLAPRMHAWLPIGTGSAASRAGVKSCCCTASLARCACTLARTTLCSEAPHHCTARRQVPTASSCYTPIAATHTHAIVPQVMHVIDTVLLPTQLFKGEKLTAKVIKGGGVGGFLGVRNWEGQMPPGGGDVFDLSPTAG